MKRILENIINKTIEDIIMVGRVDIDNIDNIADFCADKTYLYFKIESEYIEFKSVEQFSCLAINSVKKIPFNYEVDEDMIKGKISISEIVLNDTMAYGNCISRAIVYDLDEKNGICAGLELILENGQVLFIDPSFYFGINIGGEKQKKYGKKTIWK